MATIAKLCLPAEREVELWLRLEVWQNGGSNLYNLRIVDFNLGQVYATADKPHEDEKEKTFFLYWRGKLPAGQPELTIQYQATQRFPLAQSKPNGFFYGYRIMPEGYSQVVAPEPHGLASLLLDASEPEAAASDFIAAFFENIKH